MIFLKYHRPFSPSLLLMPILTLAAVSLVAGDWPQWRGPTRDGRVPDNAGLARLPAEPGEVWKIPAGDGLASPVVAGGKVFLFDAQNGKETLRALNAKTGAVLWTNSVDEAFKDSQGPAGPRSTPLVDGSRVYVQSCRGQLQCIDVGSGRSIWGVNYSSNFGAVFIGEKGSAQGAARHGNNASPLIDGQRLVALVGGTNEHGVVAFDKATGKVLWHALEDDPAYAPPVIGQLGGARQLVCFLAEALVGLDPASGRELWRVPFKTRFARHVITPLVFEDLVIISSHEFGLVAVKISKSGGSQWQAEKQWESREAAVNFSSPVLVEGAIFGVGPRKNLMAVDARSGKINWSQDGLLQTSADKAHAGFLVFAQSILMLNDSGELVLFGRDASAFRSLGRVQVSGANWCNPAWSDGVLYLRDGVKAGGEARAIALLP